MGSGCRAAACRFLGNSDVSTGVGREPRTRRGPRTVIGPATLRGEDHRAFVVGRSTVNVLPRPGSLDAAIEPPWASAIQRQMLRPSPVPTADRAGSTW